MYLPLVTIQRGKHSNKEGWLMTLRDDRHILVWHVSDTKDALVITRDLLNGDAVKDDNAEQEN